MGKVLGQLAEKINSELYSSIGAKPDNHGVLQPILPVIRGSAENTMLEKFK